MLKRPVRVLSLFDGIATALHILKDVLHLQVEVYFSCEIDADALQLQTYKYSGEIVQLGEAEKVDPGKEGDNMALLSALGRIDLMVGGPPCGDTSRVNPNRRRLSKDLPLNVRDMRWDLFILMPSCSPRSGLLWPTDLHICAHTEHIRKESQRA